MFNVMAEAKGRQPMHIQSDGRGVRGVSHVQGDRRG